MDIDALKRETELSKLADSLVDPAIDLVQSIIKKMALAMVEEMHERTVTSNAALRQQQERCRELEEALQFYADGKHKMQGFDGFDTVSGEPQSIECWSLDTFDSWGAKYEHDMTVENGGLARQALGDSDKV